MMTDDLTGRLPSQISGHTTRLDELLASMTGKINELRVLMESARSVSADEVLTICTDLRIDLFSAKAEVNGIRTSFAAAKMTHQTVTNIRGEDLELHPRNLPDRTPLLPGELIVCGHHRSRVLDGKWKASNPETEGEE